jgi:hypothetical protein
MKTNEFVAKKIGELSAFTKLGSETIEKVRGVLNTVLGEEFVIDMIEKNHLHSEELLRIATDEAVVDLALSGAKNSQEKITAMRELYMGTNWEGTVEILEWSSCFEGATIAHWALLKGIAEGLNHEGLLTISNEGLMYHYELLEKFESELGSLGQNKVIQN